MDVLKAIRARVGEDFILGVRYTADECLPGGTGKAEGLEISKRLKASGLIDYLNVIRGHIDTDAGLTDVIPVQGMANSPHLDFAGEIRAATAFPTSSSSASAMRWRRATPTRRSSMRSVCSRTFECDDAAPRKPIRAGELCREPSRRDDLELESPARQSHRGLSSPTAATGWVRKKGLRGASAFIATAFAQNDGKAGQKQFRSVADQLRPKMPSLAAVMDEAETGVLAYMDLPQQHWIKRHSTNPIERPVAEIKRRTNAIGIFPDEAAIGRLVDARHTSTARLVCPSGPVEDPVFEKAFQFVFVRTSVDPPLSEPLVIQD
jgi:hypothetical protein